MSLREYEVTNILKDCDYYNQLIDRPTYPLAWSTPFFKNSHKKCIELKARTFSGNPTTRSLTSGGINSNNIFSYKTQRPISNFIDTTIPKYEAFSKYKKNINILWLILLIIVFVVILKI
jgi:hypothetical protein